jgi:hypothetical protein
MVISASGFLAKTACAVAKPEIPAPTMLILTRSFRYAKLSPDGQHSKYDMEFNLFSKSFALIISVMLTYVISGGPPKA